MATELWGDQIGRLLAQYREPEVDPKRVQELGREIAGRLHEDGLLEATLESLVPRHEDPAVDAARLEKIGLEISGLLRERPLARPRPRTSRSRAEASGGGAVFWAAAAVAAGLLILLSLQSSPAKPVPRPAQPVVVAPPAPATEVVPGPVERPVDLPPPPPPERSVTVIPRPEPVPPPELPAPVPPAPAPIRAAAETVAAPVAGETPRLERFEGVVDIVAAEGTVRRKAVAGQDVPSLSTVETSGKGGRAVLRYRDGTTLDLGSGSLLQLRLPASGAKELSLGRGTLAASVSPQPAGKPLLVLTPQADVRVLGTQFLLTADAAASRLEVREGKVRFTRRSDGTAVDVSAGHFSVASRGLALLTRPLPEEPKTAFYEIEEFGSARGTKPADGMVRRLFLEPFDGAVGGTCVSVPAAGMDVTGELKLQKGAWQVWVRYRDEPGNSKIGFTVLIGDQVVGQATTPGRDRSWIWKRFPIVWGGGPARITLRSTSEGVKATPDRPDFRQSPYGALNRWDRLCLTPDESFVPE